MLLCSILAYSRGFLECNCLKKIKKPDFGLTTPVYAHFDSFGLLFSITISFLHVVVFADTTGSFDWRATSTLSGELARVSPLLTPTPLFRTPEFQKPKLLVNSLGHKTTAPMKAQLRAMQRTNAGNMTPRHPPTNPDQRPGTTTTEPTPQQEK